jgi:O-antigen ligase
MAKKKQNNKISKKVEFGWGFMLPLMFIVAIIPLITFLKIVDVEGIERLNWKGSDKSVDFFSYYKSLFFIIATFASLAILVLMRLVGEFRFKKSKYYIPLGIYVVFVFLSFMFSEFDIVANRGFVDLFQGVWVLLGYGIVLFACINYIQNEKHVKLLVGSYIFVGLLMASIGLGQYFGYDIFKTDFGKYLILPEYMHSQAENLKFTFGEKTIYATLYNINYVGSFAALLIFIASALFLYVKGVKQTIFSGIFLGLMVALLIGSNSRAGLIGFVVGFLLIIILFRKSLKRNINKIVVILALGIMAVIIMNFVSDGVVLKEIASINPLKELAALRERESIITRIEDVKFDDNSVEIVTEYESLKIISDGEDFLFEDENRNLLESKLENNIVKLLDEKYSRYKIKREDENGRFILQVYNQKMKIYYTEDGLRMLGSGGVLGKTAYPERLEFMDGYERAASARGYIWSRSVPMLKDTLIIGHGPDSYAIVFPQKDYVGKMNAFYNEAIIVDKPHNMYLQIGINTGLVSLIALLAICLIYFIDSMKLYFKRVNTTFLEHMGVGSLAGVFSYLGAGFFNDQVISVAPLFYVLLGLGIAINSLVKIQDTVEK